MKKTFLALALLLVLIPSSFAWWGGPCGPGWGPGWGHCGYWGPGGRAAFWTGFGLNCGALALSTAAICANAYRGPAPYYGTAVYASPAPIVYQQPAIVYQQAAPSVVYVQQPQQTVVYTQPAAVPTAPATATATAAAQAPVQVQPAALPASSAPETSAFRMPNSNGSETLVTLTRHGSGWLGPQGEYYPSYPSQEQIRERYK